MSVERRIGEAESCLRGEACQLPAAERECAGDDRLPAVEERRRRDVVVVDDQWLGSLRDEVGDRRPDRRVVEEPRLLGGMPVAPRSTVREGTVGTGKLAELVLRLERVNLGSIPRLAQHGLHAEVVRANGVARRESRDELVDRRHHLWLWLTPVAG